MKRLCAILLAATILLGICVQAAADDMPDFLDMPADHWAYEPVMDMARQGVMKGVGDGRFDPEGKLTAEMFIVLIGRILYPDIIADGDDWSGPYVARATEEGLLLRTTVTDETLKREIIRYDVANILCNTKVVTMVTNITRDQLENVEDERELDDLVFDREFDKEHALADWEGMEWHHYVKMVYLAGLMRGDQDKNFNGDGTLTRMEAAVVLQRFSALWETAKVTRQLKVERAQRELKALSTEKLSDLSQEELADLLVKMDDTSVLDVFDMMDKKYGYFGGMEERSLVLEGIGVPEEDFDAAYAAAAQRKWDLDGLREDLDGATPETLADVEPRTLVSTFYSINDGRKGEEEVVLLMRDFGATAADLEAAYRKVYETAVHIPDVLYEMTVMDRATIASDTFERQRQAYWAAAELARTAAVMAKAEGKETFTILAHGGHYLNTAIGPYKYAEENVQLGLYGEDGRLIGQPKLRMEDDRWEMEVEINTDNLDEEFTLKFLEPFVIEEDRYDYHVLPERTDDAKGDMRELIKGLLTDFRGSMRWK